MVFMNLLEGVFVHNWTGAPEASNVPDNLRALEVFRAPLDPDFTTVPEGLPAPDALSVPDVTTVPAGLHAPRVTTAPERLPALGSLNVPEGLPAPFALSVPNVTTVPERLPVPGASWDGYAVPELLRAPNVSEGFFTLLTPAVPRSLDTGYFRPMAVTSVAPDDPRNLWIGNPDTSLAVTGVSNISAYPGINFSSAAYYQIARSLSKSE